MRRARKPGCIVVPQFGSPWRTQLKSVSHARLRLGPARQALGAGSRHEVTQEWQLRSACLINLAKNVNTESRNTESLKSKKEIRGRGPDVGNRHRAPRREE